MWPAFSRYIQLYRSAQTSTSIHDNGTSSRVPRIVFYAENDHYDVDDAWTHAVAAAKTRFDNVLIERDVDATLLDHGFIPTTDVESQHSDRYDATKSALSGTADNEVAFDVRHLLDIPIGPSLSDVFANAAAYYGLELFDAFEHLLNAHYVRNLLQPSISYLNMLASLKLALTPEKYARLQQLYHDVLSEIQAHLRKWKQKLSNALSHDDEAMRANAFADLLELIMFRLPAMLTDVYLVGLVMSKAPGSVMVVCGTAHAVHAREKLEAIYGAGCCEILDSSSARAPPVV